MEDRYQLFETIERLTGKTLLESELDEICRLFDDDNSLKKENKRLALQVEIISGAYETSKKRVKELEIENTVKKRLEAEYASLLGVCKKIALEESSFKRESYILDLCNILDEF